MVGIFELHFFVYISLAGIFFRMQKLFSRLLAAHEFFYSILISLRELFFCTSPPPPLHPITFLMVRP